MPVIMTTPGLLLEKATLKPDEAPPEQTLGAMLLKDEVVINFGGFGHFKCTFGLHYSYNTNQRKTLPPLIRALSWPICV
jgi:hypothetical protein